jgi:saccharopine dehydrogenase (NAD+, L-lysine-forming)
LKIVVSGTKDGAAHTYVFSLSSTREGAGEGTGIPAALGALLLHRGRITSPGVHPPEAVVDPVEMLELAGQVIGHFGLGNGHRGGVPIHIEHVGPEGTRNELHLAF